jgi:hypothetical protein
VNVFTSEPDNVFDRFVEELDSTLARDHLRLRPRLRRAGLVQGLDDLKHLSGVNLGVIQADSLDNLADGHPARRRLRYIARLYNKEFHVIASRDITELRQLHNQKVNIDNPGTGTHLTARHIFRKLGVAADFTEYNQAIAQEKLRGGEIAAAVYVAPRPSRELAEFAADPRFHLVPIAYTDELSDYVPAEFKMSDYPNLIDAERRVDTVAVATVLATVDWPEGSERHKRLARFIDAYFSRFEQLRDGNAHPKWAEATPSAIVPGWRRFKFASEWLHRRSRGELCTGGEPAAQCPAPVPTP